MQVQQADPIAVVTALDEALNAGRLESALALFGGDAAVTFPGQPEPNRFVGKEQIRGWLQSDISEGIHVEARVAGGGRAGNVDGAPVAGGRRERGITLLKGQAAAVVRDGRIVSFTYAVSPGGPGRTNEASSTRSGTMKRNLWSCSARRLVALVGSTVLAGLFVFGEHGYAQERDPMAAFTGLHAAVNAHDVDAALAFFAPDAVDSPISHHRTSTAAPGRSAPGSRVMPPNISRSHQAISA
jgi:ketosteroid isomerase-like protein